jgi:hypothetical protein
MELLVKAWSARDTGGMKSEGQAESVALPKAKRRWFQYGTRAMLVVVTVAGVTLGVVRSRVERQRRAVAAINEVGGYVEYVPSGSANSDGAIDRLLRMSLPSDYFDEVVMVNLNGTRATDDTMAQVGRLTGLRAVYLDRTSVSDVGLSRLHGLSALIEISWEDSQVTRAGIAAFFTSRPNCNIQGDDYHPPPWRAR